jgi:Tat protein translocase TatB subunit
MFDIGWIEMMVIVVVMIIVIGPKDLPRVLHTLGQWVSRAREMARGFQDSIEEMANEAGLDKVREKVGSMRDFDLKDSVEKAIDPKGELAGGIDQVATSTGDDPSENKIEGKVENEDIDVDYYDEDDDYGDEDDDEDYVHTSATWERNTRLPPSRMPKRRSPGAVNRVLENRQTSAGGGLKARRAPRRKR